MSDLISRSALLEKIQFRIPNERVLTDIVDSCVKITRRIIEEAPTVDAVEVVRCKDCDVPHNKWTGCPNLNGLVPPPNHFCSLGERKDNG